MEKNERRRFTLMGVDKNLVLFKRILKRLTPSPLRFFVFFFLMTERVMSGM